MKTIKSQQKYVVNGRPHEERCDDKQHTIVTAVVMRLQCYYVSIQNVLL